VEKKPSRYKNVDDTVDDSYKYCETVINRTKKLKNPPNPIAKKIL